MAARVRNTYSCTSRAAFFNQRSSNGNTRRSAPRRARERQLWAAQPFDFVAEGGRFLEIEVRSGCAHLFLLFGEVGVELLLVVEALGTVERGGRRHVVALVDARHH